MRLQEITTRHDAQQGSDVCFFLREGFWKTVIFFGAKKCCGVGFSKLEIVFFSANPWDMKKIERSTSKRNTHSFDQQIIHHLPFVPEKLLTLFFLQDRMNTGPPPPEQNDGRENSCWKKKFEN